MENENIKEYEKAGRIAAMVREHARTLVKPGATLLSVAKTLEDMIIKEGCGIAFPVNISINNNAAHYTPSFDDKLTFSENDVVKVDVGTHVEGCIGDTAITIDLSGKNAKLLEASEQALEAAIATVKAGISTADIGAAIEKEITSRNFKPIINLCGHVLAPYVVHSGFSIPNVETQSGFELEEGLVIAIEPFATTGTGMVRESTRTEIFSQEKMIKTRNPHARKLQDFVNDYKGMPFAERWLYEKMPELQLKLALRELAANEAFRSYPVLHDIDGSLVSQHEHSVLVEKDGCKLLTKR